MTTRVMSTTRTVGLSTALLLAAALMAAPVFAQGTSPSPSPGASQGQTGSGQQQPPGSAQNERPTQIPGEAAGAGGNLGTESIRSGLERLGFTDVQDVSPSGDDYEATAQWGGDHVSMTIDPQTGQITYRDAE